MTEAVINKLSRIPSIRVEPFARVRRYGDLDQDPLAAGRALGVDAVLEGYFHHIENRVRVRVRLLRTSNGRALATNEWNDAFTDMLQVQSRVAESVAAALELALNPAQMAGVLRQDTVNLEAYQHYLFGRYHLDVREFQRMVQAERAFREAIRLSRLRPRVFRSRFGPPGRSLARWTTGHRRVTTGKGGCPESSGHRRIHRSGALGAR